MAYNYVLFPGFSVSKWLPLSYNVPTYNTAAQMPIYGGITFVVDEADKGSFEQLQKDVAAAKKAGKVGVSFCDAVVYGNPKESDLLTMNSVDGTVLANTTSDNEEDKKYWVTHVVLSGNTVTLGVQAPISSSSIVRGTLVSVASGGVADVEFAPNVEIPAEAKNRLTTELHNAINLKIVKSE